MTHQRSFYLVAKVRPHVTLQNILEFNQNLINKFKQRQRLQQQQQ